jgi:polysaccharide biosynthesis protein PelC
MKMMKWLLLVAIGLFAGCSQTQIESPYAFPTKSPYAKIAVYALHNYTDTPQAGMRAANIVEGVLLARGFNAINAISESSAEMTLDDKLLEARKKGMHYIITGGVSEWRYKTGIDGEPAVSLQLKVISVATGNVLWSTTASDHDWGNASIGTTAQSLIEEMLSSEAAERKANHNQAKS